MKRVDAENQMKLSEANVCSIPLKKSRQVSIPEFQQCIVDAKNKGQMLRCCFRFLSQFGGNSNAEDRPKYWPKIREYIEDFHEEG